MPHVYECLYDCSSPIFSANRSSGNEVEAVQDPASSVPQLVVMGASAGGIEALGSLLGTLPATFPAPVVIAQHLDPNRTSHLEEILTRRSALPIHSVTQQVP